MSDAQYICQFPGCEDEATAGRFGHTFCEPHNEQTKAEAKARKRSRNASSSSSGGGGSLKGRIRDSVLMTAAVVAIKDPNIYVAVEATVDEFATAWDNVAKQSPTARRYIESLLTGGVWLSAMGATLVMVVTTAAVTGNLPPRWHPLGHYCIGIAGIKVEQVPAPPPAATNGGAGVGAREAADQ